MFKFSNGSVAGPRITAPVAEKSDPWHGQSKQVVHDIGVALLVRADPRQAAKGRVARAHHCALVADVDDLADGRQAGELRDLDRDRTADGSVRIAARSAVDGGPICPSPQSTATSAAAATRRVG